MLYKNIFFKNNLTKKYKIVFKSKKAYFDLIKEYRNNKIPLFSSFRKDYKLDFGKKIIQKFKKKKNIVIVGMGGSILGSKAIYSFFRNKIKKNFHFLDNLGETNLSKLFSKKLSKTLYIFVSKSGNTIETVSNFFLIKKKSKKDSSFLFVTEKKKNILYDLAQKLKYEVIEHKNYIGGRYSVLSEVGMLPAALMNLDINKFKNFNHLIKDKKFINILLQNTQSLYALSKRNTSNSVILSYDSDLEDLSYWYQQLVAESLGKKGKGFTPIVSTVPKDHHSLLQLYLDGPKNKFFTILSSKSEKKFILRNDLFLKDMKFLNGKKLANIVTSQKMALEKSFIRKNIPYRSFNFLKKNEEELGFIFTFFILETVLLSRLMRVNPFNQPAVESVKIDTKKILLKN